MCKWLIRSVFLCLQCYPVEKSQQREEALVGEHTGRKALEFETKRKVFTGDLVPFKRFGSAGTGAQSALFVVDVTDDAAGSFQRIRVFRRSDRFRSVIG